MKKTISSVLNVKKTISAFLALTLCAVMLLSIAPITEFAQAQEFTLTVLNPRAQIEKLPITPLAERLDTFRGAKIGLYNISGAVSWAAYQELLAERFNGPSGNNPLGVSWVAGNAKGGVDFSDNYTNYESYARVSDAVIVGTAH